MKEHENSTRQRWNEPRVGLGGPGLNCNSQYIISARRKFMRTSEECLTKMIPKIFFWLPLPSQAFKVGPGSLSFSNF